MLFLKLVSMGTLRIQQISPCIFTRNEGFIPQLTLTSLKTIAAQQKLRLSYLTYQWFDRVMIRCVRRVLDGNHNRIGHFSSGRLVSCSQDRASYPSTNFQKVCRAFAK